ncbi:hypothetical protein CFC21_035054 [Triticum aestivum]|uniref:AT4G36440-like protein n=3 Tax=Triticum TaxID=4564 RepID=A0A9R0RG95_TRITD|nr:uncharacterized protein LOC123061024 [Triticum aestivum]XP_044339850.1 uncharacterized protein LOC123061024 [Triticum aestivum]XP_044339851.1 uncharacterized protein LOC123061024 [Triticum aestivum]XP_044339852.1 uncharacterized protein LOC123061024 [Triticum aestivum]XP_044339853.1 uncharacterized protein LOC123061024 [Triticum aestivum]XP_044339854.1 uncharacterized protein LOC123061024 [Triticum aestivum]XP_044339855.1 uncharacterized protein LOC123061024 [Triticum aestivum]XP_04433985
MLVKWSTFASCPLDAFRPFIIVLLAAAYIHVPATAIVAVPSSHCYTFDSDSHLVDFTHLSGKNFEYNEEGSVTSDLVVQLCKDVQRRSQAGGFIDFGRFTNHRSFETGSKPVDYIQRFYNGDLAKCETTFEEMGRTAQVNIMCGRCSNKVCKDEHGCICSVSYDERMCRTVVELAIPCPKRGPRVFKGFTVGFHPRSSEVVYNGLTQLGFEQLHHGFSFPSEQIHVSLYLSAMSSLADLVGKPTFRVNPMKGLDVMLTGSGANGAVPTALSPTVLNVNWICEIIRSNPYVVNVSIPVAGYDPIEFTLTKECGYTQEKESDSMRGWATFGIISCIFIVFSSLLCCGGFIYRSRVEHQDGLHALPGMTTVSAFLDAVGRPRGYLRAGDPSGNHSSQVSWENTSVTTPAAQRTNDGRYGTI